MGVEALGRELTAPRSHRLPEYRIEEALRARLDEALEFRRGIEPRLLRRPEVVERLLAEAGSADDRARRHVVNRCYRDAAIEIERVETTLAQVHELGRVLDAITSLREEVERWRNDIDPRRTLAAAATLRIPPRLIAEADRFAAAGRPRAAWLLVDMAREEQRRWAGDEQLVNTPCLSAPEPPSGEGEPARSLAALAAAGRPLLAARLAEDLITVGDAGDGRRARSGRLLVALAATRRRAAGALASAHEDPAPATCEPEERAR
jgi:hypothetical protein